MAETINFGPQKDAVQAILDKWETLTLDEKRQLRDLRDDAFWAGWNVARDGRAGRAGLSAAQYALGVRLRGGWHVGGRAAYGAALAVLLRHTFTPEEWPHYEALTKPWVTVTGTPAHPDDVVAEESGTSVTEELKLLEIVVHALSQLDTSAQRRTLTYLNDRFREVA
jgi:hypothetical protein